MNVIQPRKNTKRAILIATDVSAGAVTLPVRLAVSSTKAVGRRHACKAKRPEGAAIIPDGVRKATSKAMSLL